MSWGSESKLTNLLKPSSKLRTSSTFHQPKEVKRPIQTQGTTDSSSWLDDFKVWTVGFWVALVVKNLSTNAGDIWDSGSIPGLGRFPGEREWQPTLVFLAGESHGQRSLVGYNSWDHKESDMTEVMYACKVWIQTREKCVVIFISNLRPHTYISFPVCTKYEVKDDSPYLVYSLAATTLILALRSLAWFALISQAAFPSLTYDFNLFPIV